MDEVIGQLAREVIDDDRPTEEVVDEFINTAEASLQLKILDELGSVDLSEPALDPDQGWERLRGQLAYNALYAAVSRRVKELRE